MHLGIDYGAKLAGTTAICYEQAGRLQIVQSENKNPPTDTFTSRGTLSNPSKIYIFCYFLVITESSTSSSIASLTSVSSPFSTSFS